MRKLNWKAILALLLALFFAVGGIGNIFLSDELAADYRRWGYPDWFHYMTGVLELGVAALLVRRSTRVGGAVLACLIMAAAAGTVLLHGEYTHAAAPLLALAVAISVAMTAREARPG